MVEFEFTKENLDAIFSNIKPLKTNNKKHDDTHLTYPDLFNDNIPVGSIPNTITHLKFGYYFNKPILIGTIPENVTHLTFGHSFNQPLEPGMIPNSVTHLTFGSRFNQPLNRGIIPESLEYLHLDCAFTNYESLNDISENTFLTCTIYEEHKDLNDDRYLNKEIILKRVNHLVIHGIDCYNQIDINHVIPDELMKRIYHNLSISVLVDFKNIFEYNNFEIKSEDNYFGDSPHYEKYKYQLLGPYQDFFYIQTPNSIFPMNYEKIQNKRKQINLLKSVHQELVVKVFDPVRIQNICENYHIDFIDWINIIS